MKIALDPGHGGHDSGVVSNVAREKDQALRLALTLKFVLEQEYGLEVYMTRTEDVYPQLFDRTAEAAHAGCKLFCSVHFDIAVSGWRWGTYHDDKTSSRALAGRVSRALDDLNGSIGAWVRSHTESRFGRLYIADFLPQIPTAESILIEFGPVRVVDKAERIQLARAIAPHLAWAVKS